MRSPLSSGKAPHFPRSLPSLLTDRGLRHRMTLLRYTGRWVSTKPQAYNTSSHLRASCVSAHARTTVEQLTLYSAKVCPFSQRAELTLEEAKIPHEKFCIDLKHKPEWYAPKVNPASKVPAVAYGGPDVPPENPSPESAKITESLVLVQFFADLAPESDLLPKDALGRARVRSFLDAVNNKIQPNLVRWALGSGSHDAFFEALDAIQEQLPPIEEGKYLFGNKFTLADIAVAPFLGRTLLIQLRNGIGKFDEQEALRGWERFQGPKYQRLRQYISDITARPSWQSTFDEPYLVQAAIAKQSA